MQMLLVHTTQMNLHIVMGTNVGVFLNYCIPTVYVWFHERQDVSLSG